MKQRDVQYPLQGGTVNVREDLPESPNGRWRSSPVEEALAEIQGHAEVHGKWVEVASYGNGGAASSQANELRKRHGYKASKEGWSFATARADGEDGNPRTGLFAKFDPAAATAEGEQEHTDETARRRAKAAGRKPRGKAKANA